MPATQSRKFAYADDNAQGSQHKNPKYIEHTLTNDLAILEKYYRDWRLCPNPDKTEVSYFHLCNREAKESLNVTFCGKTVTFNPNPKYLGYTMDRTQTHKPHLEKVAQKLKSRNNVIQKLAGTTWGSNGNTLRTAALSLVYSTAEYCCPVWLRSAHTNKVDTQLHATLRTVTGTLNSTPLPWLPVLANIAPPNIRRGSALAREWTKISLNDTLPIHQDLATVPPVPRLKSRNPIWKEPFFTNENFVFKVEDEWRELWNQETVRNKQLVTDPSDKPKGMEEPRKIWCRLNRMRTGHGRCASMLYKWNMTTSPYCDCGDVAQSTNHIVNDCVTRKFIGGLLQLHEASPDAIHWLQQMDIDL